MYVYTHKHIHMIYAHLILCKPLKNKECVILVESLAPPKPNTREYLVIGTNKSIDVY